MKSAGWSAGVLAVSLLFVGGCNEVVGQAEEGTNTIILNDGKETEQKASELVSDETGLTMGTHELLINGAELSGLLDKLIEGRDGYLEQMSDFQQDLYFEENATIALQITKDVEALALTLPPNEENETLYSAYEELHSEMKLASQYYYEMSTSENDEVYLSLMNDSMKKVNVLHKQFVSELQFVKQKLN